MNLNKNFIIATGYEAYFENGVLVNVNPRNKAISLYDDRQIAYEAQYIISNGVKYDLENAQSISNIPIPKYNKVSDSIPNTTFDLAYILKIHLEKEERPNLAVPLAYKSANIMMESPIGWRKKDYYQLVVQLWSIGEFTYGDFLLQELKRRLPDILADNDRNIF